MVAWKLFADGKTPKNQKVKGDKFVGEYTVGLGSYVDVVNAVAEKEGYAPPAIEYV